MPGKTRPLKAITGEMGLDKARSKQLGEMVRSHWKSDDRCTRDFSYSRMRIQRSTLASQLARELVETQDYKRHFETLRTQRHIRLLADIYRVQWYYVRDNMKRPSRHLTAAASTRKSTESEDGSWHGSSADDNADITITDDDYDEEELHHDGTREGTEEANVTHPTPAAIASLALSMGSEYRFGPDTIVVTDTDECTDPASEPEDLVLVAPGFRNETDEETIGNREIGNDGDEEMTEQEDQQPNLTSVSSSPINNQQHTVASQENTTESLGISPEESLTRAVNFYSKYLEQTQVEGSCISEEGATFHILQRQFERQHASEVNPAKNSVESYRAQAIEAFNEYLELRREECGEMPIDGQMFQRMVRAFLKDASQAEKDFTETPE